MITPNGNYGVGGVLTGLPGSVRTPRIFAAPTLGTTGAFTTLTPSRYINDQPKPLFIEQLVVQPGTGLGAGDIQIGLKAAGYDITTTPGRLGVLFELVLGNSVLILNWKFSRPLMLLEGEGIEILTDAPPNSMLSAMGYYESNPAPQQFRFVPAVLTDQVRVPANEFVDFREEALRNDGKTSIYMTRFAFSALSTSFRYRIRGSKYDWMSSRLTGTGLIHGTMHTPLHESELKPTETLSVQVENTSGSATDVYFAVVGFRAIPMQEEKSHVGPVGPRSSNPEALFRWQL